MTLSRQQAFEQLRPVCVELSSVALRFKGQQATVKQNLRALQDVQAVLDRPQIQTALDEKLAEYAFFPLTHIFNQSQALSSTCVEVAIQCIIVLVSKGWRDKIATEMGKQLLILMSLLAGGQTKTGGTVPTDELKTLAFTCIKVVIEALAGKKDGGQLFNDLGSRSVTDQLAYLLLESITDSASDQVQLAASNAMTAVVSTISDRVVLASLLPRTASSLTQALRTSTKARRTRKVLSSYLVLLRILLQAVLADSVAYPLQSTQPDRVPQDEQIDALDESWLRATAEQVKLALTQVMRLRSHEDIQVRTALADLCFMAVEDCPKSLAAALAVVVESLIYLAHMDDAQMVRSRLEFLTNSETAVAEIVREKLYDWCQSLPRTMQSIEDRPKQQLFGQIGAAFSILSQTIQISNGAISRLVDGLVEGLCTIGHPIAKQDLLTEQVLVGLPSQLELQSSQTQQAFKQIILARPNEEQSSRQLHRLLWIISQQGYANRVAQKCLARYVDAGLQDQLQSAWLALQCLSRSEHESFDMALFLVADEGGGLQVNRPQLISDLYATTLPWLTEDEFRKDSSDWRLVAIAIESTVLQATQLEKSYRPELLDTIYPILSLLGSNTPQLREHAMVGLNLVAAACGYSSTSDMLVDNADYLINAVSMKLNAFDSTPQAPQVLLMMIRLCGARIVPQLDDLITSMFSALDNFHGYPHLVGTLFQVLRAIIDESKKQPRLTLTDGMIQPQHRRPAIAAASMEDILEDLEQRRRRKRKCMEQEEIDLRIAPQAPWKSECAHFENDNSTHADADAEEQDQNTASATKEAASKLSKSHQLLLSIAQATGPHLTSPAPQVRQTLLQLLEEVSPLLAQDENSFLPLINSVWPVVVPRLLAYSPTSDDSNNETAYNACAAADVIGALCRGAGSFMSTRIDDVLPHLQKLFYDILQGRKAGQPGDRSPRSQVLTALVRLLATTLSHVRLGEDAGDQLFEMLAPFASASDHGEIRQALNIYNPDALWLWNQQQVRILSDVQ